MDSDPTDYGKRLAEFLANARMRPSARKNLRIGILGVPPINTDFHEVIESFGAQIVLNEIPRQFALYDTSKNLIERYSNFSYPYGVWPRVADLRREILRREIKGIIHYTQSFCHRQIHDIILRKELGVPFLTIEGENPGPVDQRTKLRIESFLEILSREK